jgi:hypothetical protein
MSQPQDLFALSFTTRPDAGEQDGLNFRRPDAYTAEQLLVEILDLVKHPDNAHVESVEVMRIGHVDDTVAPQLAPVSLANSNAYVGWSFVTRYTHSDVPSCLIVDGHAVAAEKLVELLSDPKVESFELCW